MASVSESEKVSVLERNDAVVVVGSARDDNVILFMIGRRDMVGRNWIFLRYPFFDGFFPSLQDDS